MEKTSTSESASVNTSLGHLSVHVDGAHPPEVRFSFEQQPARLGWSVAASAIVDVAFVAFLILITRLAPAPKPIEVVIDPSNQIVWLVEPGPGGGGGGGGNQMPEPPKPAELKGKEKITVPVEKPAPIEPPKVEPKVEPNPVEQLNIPAATLAAALQELPGAIGAPSAPSLSQGSGRGGGAGTGVGTGIGPGTGSGLGPGSGGGTGGGVYQPGNGVTNPVPITIPKPKYTADAMRARIQGTAVVRCVVQPSGVCTDIQIEHSLDPTFGLDQEAINSVKLWRFKPGLRFGQPVAVSVTIAVEFALR